MQKKLCTKCQKIYNTANFRKRPNGKPQPYCLECQRQYDREYWRRTKTRRNKLKRLADNKLRARNRKYIANYLGKHPCVDCGEKDTVVLEFDHRRNKEHNISDLVRSRASIARIEEEISKCDVRCANCHRRQTAKRGNWERNI